MEGEISMFLKVAIFILVQGLVYLILSQSSNVFSKARRSHSFRTARTLSIRRWAAVIADIPAAAGDGSPSSRGFFRSFSRRDNY
ncbi:hypothetical protein OROHE_004817 [Orobanche hederae]